MGLSRRTAKPIWLSCAGRSGPKCRASTSRETPVRYGSGRANPLCDLALTVARRVCVGACVGCVARLDPRHDDGDVVVETLHELSHRRPIELARFEALEFGVLRDLHPHDDIDVA